LCQILIVEAKTGRNVIRKAAWEFISSNVIPCGVRHKGDRQIVADGGSEIGGIWKGTGVTCRLDREVP
jgi:hypothetical protein